MVEIMKIDEVLTYNLTENVGYKVMRYENGQIIAGANSRLRFTPKVGSIIKMPGNGIYMGNSKEYVMDYYSGLADTEVLITFEYNEEDMTSGNLEDKEVELSVPSAKIINVEYL